jgi:hypothetical protein
VVDKKLEEHAVAGSREQRREYLKIFEDELWIPTRRPQARMR